MRLLTFSVTLAGLLASSLALASDALPQRWVSVGGALSEWVVALGGEGKLVGVDTTSQHPASLTALPSVGYQRQLSAEGVLSLRPDVLIGTEEMGPPDVVRQLKASGVAVEGFESRADVVAVHDTLERLGRLLGEPERARQQADGFDNAMAGQAARVERAQKGQEAPGVLFLLGHAGGKPLIGGKDTAADWMISHAGGRNLATHPGYKNFSMEALLGLDPQVLIVADRSLKGPAALQALLKENPALASTRAVKQGRVYELDPTLLVGGLGPRLPQALESLFGQFYPNAGAGQ